MDENDLTELWRDKEREQLILATAKPSKPGDPVLVDPPVTNRDDGRRNAIDGLTPLQERFYHGVMRGLSQSDAVIQAGYQGDENQIRKRGSELMAHPVIQARLRALRKLSEDDFTARRADLRAHVVSQLYHLSLNAKDERQRLKALELLGKTNLVGLYSKDMPEERPPQEDAAALREKLGEIIHRLADAAEPINGPIVSQPRKRTGAARMAKASGALVPLGDRQDGNVGKGKRAYAADALQVDGIPASASAAETQAKK